MARREVTFSIVAIPIRNKYSLTNNQYIILDSIYRLSLSPDYGYECRQSKENLGKVVGINRINAHKQINILLEKGLIEKGKGPNAYRPTEGVKQEIQDYLNETFNGNGSVSKRHNDVSFEDTSLDTTVSKEYDSESKRYDNVSKEDSVSNEDTSDVSKEDTGSIETKQGVSKEDGDCIDSSHNSNNSDKNNNTIDTEKLNAFFPPDDEVQKAIVMGIGSMAYKIMEKFMFYSKALKTDPHWNKRTAYLLTIYLKVRYAVKKNWAVRDETKIKYLTMFYKYDKEFSYRVQALALHKIGEDAGFTEGDYAGGFGDAYYEKWLGIALGEADSKGDCARPAVYDPGKKKWVKLNFEGWDSYEYREQIRIQGLKMGDMIKKEV